MYHTFKDSKNGHRNGLFVGCRGFFRIGFLTFLEKVTHIEPFNWFYVHLKASVQHFSLFKQKFIDIIHVLDLYMKYTHERVNILLIVLELSQLCIGNVLIYFFLIKRPTPPKTT